VIDLYYWPTPNGHKITLFLEESGLPYRIVPVDISKGEQSLDRSLGDASQDLGHFPALKRWFDAIAARPATVRAYEREAATHDVSV
jgi:GST-like protein